MKEELTHLAKQNALTDNAPASHFKIFEEMLLTIYHSKENTDSTILREECHSQMK